MPDSVGTKVEVTEAITKVEVTNNNSIGVTLEDSTTEVTVNNFGFQYQQATNSVVTPYKTITATNVQAALEQLADQDFRGTSAPTGSNIQEGDTWYDTDDEQFKVYRETSTGTFQWVPIMVGAAGGDSDTIDAGSY